MTGFDVAALAPPLRVPRLAAGPVVLRAFALDDLALVREAATDPSVASVSSVPRAYTDDTGRAFIRRQLRRATDGDGFSFVIAENAVPPGGGAGIGSIGLWLHEIDNGRASIGYWLVAGARGRGLAGFALRALVVFAFEELRIPRLHLFVEPWNVASARTAESAGFVREATLRGWERIDGEQRDADCYSLLRSEWSPRSASAGPAVGEVPG
ncbi:MAG TPA: GNAT family protein [Acidimicrobiales bacterium]|nr:GNAT family protein [Acidimicrobiales bacterium]